MTRKEILDKAIEQVTGKREIDYGKPEDNFSKISKLWSAYLGFPVVPLDVAMMMSLLKIARIRSGSGSTDDCFIDLAGYAACGGEIVSKDNDVAVCDIIVGRKEDGYTIQKVAKMYNLSEESIWAKIKQIVLDAHKNGNTIDEICKKLAVNEEEVKKIREFIIAEDKDESLYNRVKCYDESGYTIPQIAELVGEDETTVQEVICMIACDEHKPSFVPAPPKSGLAKISCPIIGEKG